MELLTIFATPKPFVGKAKVHQTNAFESWAKLPAEVLIFDDVVGAEEICDRLKFKHHKEIYTMDKVPLLHELFSVAQEKAKHEVLMYVNSDVIVVDGLLEVIKALERETFLGVCRRWDITLDEALDFSNDWRHHVKTLIGQGELHSECSSDIFLFRKGLWALPEFAVGRPGWDNWMMWKATQQGYPVINLTPSLILAHPYHLSGPDQNIPVAQFWTGDRLAARNRLYVKGNQQWCLSHVQKAGNLWELRPSGLVKC